MSWHFPNLYNCDHKRWYKNFFIYFGAEVPRHMTIRINLVYQETLTLFVEWKNGARKCLPAAVTRSVGGWIRLIVGFQPLMVISPTAGWIRWCMQVYAWWCKMNLSCLGRTIYARHFLGAKPPIQFRHRWAERNHSDHLYWPRAAQSVA